MIAAEEFPLRLVVTLLLAVAVVLANVVLRTGTRAIERTPADAGGEVRTRYRLRATCREHHEGQVRVLLVQGLSGGAFTLRTVESRDVEGDGTVEVVAEITTFVRDDPRIEKAVKRLSLEADVTCVRWDVRTDLEVDA